MHNLKQIKPESIILLTELTFVIPHEYIKFDSKTMFFDSGGNCNYSFTAINEGVAIPVNAQIKSENLDLVYTLNMDTGNDISLPIVNQLQYSAYINYLVTGNICIDIEAIYNPIIEN